MQQKLKFTSLSNCPVASYFCIRCVPDAGYLCIPAVLPILKEVADSSVPDDKHQAQENEEDPASVILGVVANIFQKIIELLARRLRKEPEEGKQVDILNPKCADVFIFVYYSL